MAMELAAARTVKDVSPHDFVKAYSAHLKRSGKQMEIGHHQQMERGEGSSNPQKSDGLTDTRIIGKCGLKLTITSNFIKMMEKTSAQETALREEFPPDPKSKASNVHALSITIGDWHSVAEHNGGIIAKCYFAKKKLVWEVLMDEQQQKKKIEFMWDNITAIRATFHEEQPNTLQVELGKQPLFFAECAPQPRKNTTWESCTDFTDGYARLNRMHTLTFSADGKFEKFYQKLIHFMPDLYLSSRRRFESLEHPYFEQVERPSSSLNRPLFADMSMFADPSSLNFCQSAAADANAAMVHGSIPPDQALLTGVVQQQPLAQAPIEQVYHVVPISVKQPAPPPGGAAQAAPASEGFGWTGDGQYYPGHPGSLVALPSEDFNMDIDYYGTYQCALMAASAASLGEGAYGPRMGAGFGSGDDAGHDHWIAGAAQVPGYANPRMMAPDYYGQPPLLQASHDVGGYNPSPRHDPMAQRNYGPSTGYHQMPAQGNYRLPPLPNQQHGRLPMYR